MQDPIRTILDFFFCGLLAIRLTRVHNSAMPAKKPLSRHRKWPVKFHCTKEELEGLELVAKLESQEIGYDISPNEWVRRLALYSMKIRLGSKAP